MESKDFDGKALLDKITHRDSFEDELWNNPKLIIENIQIPEVMEAADACEQFKAIDEAKRKKADRNKRHGWLHVLYDGINNLPTGFVKSFFNLSRKDELTYSNRKEQIKKSAENNDESFIYYQKILIDTFESQIAHKDEFPIIFYKNANKRDPNKEAIYNYLLPMYLLNSTKPDFCIVLGRQDGDDSWKVFTSLNMNEVYCDIRVFGKDAILSVRDWW